MSNITKGTIHFKPLNLTSLKTGITHNTMIKIRGNIIATSFESRLETNRINDRKYLEYLPVFKKLKNNPAEIRLKKVYRGSVLPEA